MRADKRYQPEVISTDQTLETGTKGGTAIVLTKLDSLIDPTITVTKVSRLGCT